MYIYIYICVCVCRYIPTYVYRYTPIHTYIYTYRHTYMRTCIRTYIYINIHNIIITTYNTHANSVNKQTNETYLYAIHIIHNTFDLLSQVSLHLHVQRKACDGALHPPTHAGVGTTWRFMGSYKSGIISPLLLVGVIILDNSGYPTYNPIYKYP